MVRTRLILAFVAVLLASTAASAQSVNLAWDASTDPTVTGYQVKWGTRAETYTSSIDVGNRTSWTITGLNPDQKYFFAVTSYASTGLNSSPSNEVSNDALIVQSGGTLSDLRPSLFWHNGMTGQLQTWLVAGTTVVDTRAINMGGIPDTHWKVAGIGDLNGDSFSDILWRHDTEGWLAVWFLQYNVVVSTRYLSINRMADPNWQIKGLGDVDGDKCADIIWQHTAGSIAAWIMRDTTVTSTRFFSIPSVGASQWKIAGVVDTNGDGMADLIWQDGAVISTEVERRPLSGGTSRTGGSRSGTSVATL
jgi:fibronectin type III domain protein